jgi:NADH dehydrogenase FAD-containing subunit
MKNLVVIGGGFAGSRIARKLQHKFNTTLIDTKDYFEFTPSILRTLVDPSHLKKIQVKHKKYLKNATVIRDFVTDITYEHVKFGKNNTLPYDYLVIASGSHYAAPIKEKDVISSIRSKEMKEYHEQIHKAKTITVVGGGLVGLELASELVTHCPDKKIRLLHGGNKLIERCNSKSQKYAEQFLMNQGVEIVYNELAKDKKNKTLTTQSGKSMPSDLTFFCTGITPNTEEFANFLYTALNEKKYLEVNEFLQVKGHHTIFAAGDSTGIKEEKTAQTAEAHADLVVKNIIRHESNKPMKPYILKKRPMIISLGTYKGIFEYKNIIITGILPALMKWAVERKTMWHYGNYSL